MGRLWFRGTRREREHPVDRNGGRQHAVSPGHVRLQPGAAGAGAVRRIRVGLNGILDFRLPLKIV